MKLTLSLLLISCLVLLTEAKPDSGKGGNRSKNERRRNRINTQERYDEIVAEIEEECEFTQTIIQFLQDQLDSLPDEIAEKELDVDDAALEVALGTIETYEDQCDFVSTEIRRLERLEAELIQLPLDIIDEENRLGNLQERFFNANARAFKANTSNNPPDPLIVITEESPAACDVVNPEPLPDRK